MTAAVLAALVVTTLGVTAPPAEAAGIEPSAEFAMITRINDTRAAAGLPRLVINLQMIRLARQWATTMARRQVVLHRPDLADAVDGPFLRLAENVGVVRLRGAGTTAMVEHLHRAFLASPGHRRHILGRFNQVGVGIRRSADGAMWVAVNFVQAPLGALPLYRDIDGTAHQLPVERLFVRGVVRGCSSTRFCPESSATRRQVAKVFDRATGTRRGTRYLRARCDASRYCATRPATRLYVARTAAYAVDGLQASTYSAARLAGQRVTRGVLAEMVYDTTR